MSGSVSSLSLLFVFYLVVCLSECIHVCWRGRERERGGEGGEKRGQELYREEDRQTERERWRQEDRERWRQDDREKETETGRQRERERDKKTERDVKTDDLTLDFWVADDRADLLQGL